MSHENNELDRRSLWDEHKTFGWILKYPWSF